MLLKVELHLLDDIDIAGTSKPLSYAIFGFSIFYLIENIIKIWALQWKRYTFNYLVLMDGLVSFGFFITQVIHLIIYGKTYMSKEETKLYNESTSLWGISRVINMLLIFRLIHLAPSVKVMYAIISTAVDIFRSLKPLFGIMAANYYIYALFGMQLFANKIRPESFDNKYNVSNLNEYCGTYKQLSYWALNFNDFYSSLLVLWHIMVINNWYVTVDAFVDVTNEWSRFYFYFWWFICPIVTLSMVISLILDLFVLKWERTVDTKIAAFSSRTPLIKSIHRLFNDIKWKPDDKRINDELIKHPYIDFNRLIHKADIEQDFSSE
ncbi:unnamed protein product [Brachionus calyciflorus]|uniref:Ion transport domain-containing protein n=1 Tax=Brachionus calyciflorus TaxID=104777 RepID=A0A813YRM0_9BILA|nr:unnamed protein product [Brachionus calyciflorus]